ncbi:MAG: type II toxin-antitoxin system RatA family toxin [Alphaproteobacteria bacterium]|nr:type II toxin-antitoxin system RatA family toxin [Alphaproteobacteria bacterium]
MPTHAEKRHLPYTPEQLFDLVAQVEKYPAFLPWCIGSRITKHERHESGEEVFYADLVIGYKMAREKFGSKVTLQPHSHIHVEYLSGPMKHLSNHWRFIREPDGSCTIDFYVDFEFKNALFQNLIEVFFNEAVKRMVNAFEERANALYVPLDQEALSSASTS